MSVMRSSHNCRLLSTTWRYRLGAGAEIESAIAPEIRAWRIWGGCRWAPAHRRRRNSTRTSGTAHCGDEAFDSSCAPWPVPAPIACGGRRKSGEIKSKCCWRCTVNKFHVYRSDCHKMLVNVTVKRPLLFYHFAIYQIHPRSRLKIWNW